MEFVPREPVASPWSAGVTGPTLTVLGSVFLVGGASVAAVGASVDTCGPDDGTCHNQRLGLILGGLGGAGLLGGLGLGLGLRFWKNDLGVASERFEDAAPRANPTLLGVGAALVGLGGAATAAGFFGSLLGPISASDPPSYDYFLGGAPGALLLVAGATTVAVGAPMLGLGSRKLPYEQSLQVAAGPGGLTLEGTF